MGKVCAEFVSSPGFTFISAASEKTENGLGTRLESGGRGGWTDKLSQGVNQKLRGAHCVP